ncbi:MAG: methyl viologen-reducing hydrogenase [Desulfonatronovibrio sp.]|nr:methyl viologen-reducing hydrogenase [Desulfovibrionales bacterium]
MTKVTVAEEWLNSCSGCEIAILNVGDVLVDLLVNNLDFVHIPVLIDHKYYGQTGEETELNIPEAVVGIVSGSVKNEEHKEVLLEMRKKCQILIALGTCATNGGLPALINMYSEEELKQFYYKDSPTTDPADYPTEHIPPLLDKCSALDEFVKVDLSLPGCPPHPDWIAGAILALLDGNTDYKMPERSVCDACPTIRESKKGIEDIKRLYEAAEYDPEKPLNEMRCLLEQGMLCLGPVTHVGCGGTKGAPRCISGRVPCRGCYGPIRKGAKPLVDYMGALASVGFDPSKMLDRRGYLSRFSGAHGVLKKIG